MSICEVERCKIMGVFNDVPTFKDKNASVTDLTLVRMGQIRLACNGEVAQ